MTGRRAARGAQAAGIVVGNMMEVLEMMIMKRDFVGSYAEENTGGVESVRRGEEGAVCWDVDEEPTCVPLDTWGRGALGVTVRIREATPAPREGANSRAMSRGRRTPVVAPSPRGSKAQTPAPLAERNPYIEDKIPASTTRRAPVDSDFDAGLRTRLARQHRLKEEALILSKSRSEAIAAMAARQQEIQASKGNGVPGYDHHGRVVEVKLPAYDRMAPTHVEPATNVRDPPTAEELEELERAAKGRQSKRSPTPNPVKRAPQSPEVLSPRVPTPVYEKATKSATTGLGQPRLFSLLNPAPGVKYVEGEQSKKTEPPPRDAPETMRREDYKKSVGHDNYKAQRPSTLLNSLMGRQSSLNRTVSMDGSLWAEETSGQLSSTASLGLLVGDVGSSQQPAWLAGGRPSLGGTDAAKDPPVEDRHLLLMKGGDWGRNTTPNAPILSPRPGAKASPRALQETLGGGRLMNKVPLPRNRLPTLNPTGKRKQVPPLQEVSRVPW